MYLPQRHDNLTISWLLPSAFFSIVVGENDHYSGVLSGFLGMYGLKLHGEICLGFRAFGGPEHGQTIRWLQHTALHRPGLSRAGIIPVQ
jgi:hypothetical protein